VELKRGKEGLAFWGRRNSFFRVGGEEGEKDRGHGLTPAGGKKNSGAEKGDLEEKGVVHHFYLCKGEENGGKGLALTHKEEKKFP